LYGVIKAAELTTINSQVEHFAKIKYITHLLSRSWYSSPDFDNNELSPKSNFGRSVMPALEKLISRIILIIKKSFFLPSRRNQHKITKSFYKK
jgi:hypothetical protein